RLEKLLTTHGHDVAVFTLNYPQNLPTRYAGYFVDPVDYGRIIEQKNLSKIFRVLSNSLYSFESRDNIDGLIRDFRPDVVHIQHLGPHLSCSILPVMKKYGIPVVYTLNVYTPLCINYNFINEKTNRICESCKGDRYYQVLLKRCVKGSLPASFIGMLFQYFNRFRKFYDCVDRFICPSAFMKNKCVEYSFYPEKLILLPYFLDSRPITPRYSGDNYGLFFGRLAPEKGVDIILEALKTAQIPFRIVGDGQALQNLLDLKNRLGLKNVDFLGYKSGDELVDIVSSANFVVVPSKWHEVLGLVCLEAFACGKPVIGSRMGGIPEVIRDNENGFLYDYEDVDTLSRKMIELYSDPELASRMGKASRAEVESTYGPDKHYTALMNIYTSLRHPASGGTREPPRSVAAGSPPATME
ncbi:MAG TPA: glycosyltransferase family 4 protein, partial [Acidobacteriota bacterium]|nr:glycosyltransferase family 4 protein [Acidobacteriota bacterium]